MTAAEEALPKFLSRATVDGVFDMAIEIGVFRGPTKDEEISTLGGILMELEPGQCRNKRQVKLLRWWMLHYYCRKLKRKKIKYLPARCRLYATRYETARKSLVASVRRWTQSSLEQFCADVISDVPRNLKSILMALRGGITNPEDDD